MDYANKVIWITGASSGIGEAMAYDFAREGAQLILSSRKEGQLKRVKKKCEFLGASKVIVVLMDLAKHDLIPVIVSQTIATVGQIDVLVNNGGISQRSLVKDTSLVVDKRIFDVNYFGAVAMTKAVLPSIIMAVL